MENKIKILSACLAAFTIGLCVNNYAISDTPSKIAVVDVQKVVASSRQVQDLKTEQQTKAQEVIAFVEKARKEVAETTDVNKKQALEDKYNKELNERREKIEKNYTRKLEDIDKKISAVIADQAKSGNFDIVIAKGAVLYGGTDITDSVSRTVK